MDLGASENNPFADVWLSNRFGSCLHQPFVGKGGFSGNTALQCPLFAATQTASVLACGMAAAVHATILYGPLHEREM